MHGKSYRRPSTLELLHVNVFTGFVEVRLSQPGESRVGEYAVEIGCAHDRSVVVALVHGHGGAGVAGYRGAEDDHPVGVVIAESLRYLGGHHRRAVVERPTLRVPEPVPSALRWALPRRSELTGLLR